MSPVRPLEEELLRRLVVDIRETPATPPEDYGGDVRIGWEIAGGLLIALGWGMGVVVNVIAHAVAPSAGFVFIWVHIYPTMGDYSLAALGIGLFGGILGVVLWGLGRTSPRGPLVLPGYDYSREGLL